MKVEFKHIFVSLIILLGSEVLNSCKNRNNISATNISKKELWTCSMHPEIIRDKPGTCPICGMDLVKKEHGSGGIQGIELNDLLQPTDRFVVSSIPVTTLKTSTKSIEVEALGVVSYDTRLVNTISTRVSGRIEKMYVKYRYQHIMKGDRLLDIYSPDLLTTQQELLYLLHNDPSNTSLIDAAKEKLLLLGVSSAQLQQIIQSKKASLTIAVYSEYTGHIHEAGTMPGSNLERPDVSRTTEELPIKEGMYLEKGQTIFQLFNTDRSWVLLNIFPENQRLIKKGDPVRIVPETAPNKNFRAKIDFIEPFYRRESKTLIARIYFNNTELQIPIGSQVRATVFANEREANWLPNDAILSLGVDKVVFLKSMGGFIAHKVETGFTYENQTEIISGLTSTDSVAANAQFLTDSESFIKINRRS